MRPGFTMMRENQFCEALIFRKSGFNSFTGSDEESHLEFLAPVDFCQSCRYEHKRPICLLMWPHDHGKVAKEHPAADRAPSCQLCTSSTTSNRRFSSNDVWGELEQHAYLARN